MLCQRCHLPVVMHETLARLRNGQLQVFKTPYGAEPEPSLSHTVFGQPGEDGSLIVLSESVNPLIRAHTSGGGGGPASVDSITREADMLERLFDYLTAKTDIDLPLCQPCAEAVRQGLKVEYDEACEERDAYITFLNKLRDEPVVGTQEVAGLTKRIGELERECAGALAELKDAEREREQAQTLLNRAQVAAREVQNRQESVYAERNDMEAKLGDDLVETHRLEALAAYQEAQLERLQRTNVYNDVFCIGHDGNFGTINGLRLGRLRDHKVEWSEINAAWGQALLLLATLVAKLGIKLPEYRLKPLGSMSRIDRLELDPETGEIVRSTALNLYSSGDYSFERLLYHKRLDAAMVAFLDVLKTVGRHVEAQDPTLRLPYAIDGDKIGGCSIRLSLNSSNETWTAACKYVLTNAKWILAYVISH